MAEFHTGTLLRNSTEEFVGDEPTKRLSACALAGAGPLRRISTRSQESSDHHPTQRQAAQAPVGLFSSDAEAVKKKLKEKLCKKEYNVMDFYHVTGCWQAIARSPRFEHLTLVVIGLNAMWIWIDTDYNNADTLVQADPIFQVAENLFCFYFFFEWLVRYKSFVNKRNGLRDFWFVFDSCLVGMMVSETWIMTAVTLMLGAASAGAGNASVLRIARLLRLSRMARMARLLRAVPELMTLIKGIVAALRSVCLTGLLLLLILYVYGIALKQLSSDTEMGSEYFDTVPKSILTLMVDGAFRDNLGKVIRSVGDDSPVCAVVFFTFVLLASLTVMNMLIGVVCELVSTVAAAEKEERHLTFVKDRLQALMAETGADADQDDKISKHEFLAMMENPKTFEVLSEVGVDAIGLMDIVDFIFSDTDATTGVTSERTLAFEDFMSLLLDLRGCKSATVKDMVDLRKFMQTRFQRIEASTHPKRKHERITVAERCSVAHEGNGYKSDDTEALRDINAVSVRLTEVEKLWRSIFERLRIDDDRLALRADDEKSRPPPALLDMPSLKEVAPPRKVKRTRL